MTYYLKKNMVNRYRRATASVTDFSRGIITNTDPLLNNLYEASVAFNFDFLSGVLKDGFGIKECSLYQGNSPTFDQNLNVKAIYYFKKYDKEVGLYVDYLLLYCDDGYIYINKVGEESTFSKVDDLFFESKPESVIYNYAGQDVIIFSDKDCLKIFDGNLVTTVTNSPTITSMCIHNERLFVTEGGEKTSLWFSDDFDPANWELSLEGAGYIDLRDGRGSLLKVISFGGYVYVFRNYGITKVTAYGDQTQFSVDGISSTSGKIIGGSIVSCGDKIIYLAEDGFYSFSGGKPTKILDKIQGLIDGVDNSDAKGLYFSGKYYCLLKVKNEGGDLQKVLLCYDVKSGEFTIGKGLFISDFCTIESENFCALLFICQGKNVIGTLSDKAQFFGESLKKIWISGKTDFGVFYEKRVSKVYVDTLSPIKITVSSEKESKDLYFSPSTQRQMQPTFVRGDWFKIQIQSEVPNCKISRVTLEYEYGR